MGDDSSNRGSNLRANWTPLLDHYFVDLLLDQVHRGNKTGHLFNKQAWSEMITLFNTKFGFNYDIDVFRNRYKRLRKQYNDMILLEQNGFQWDESQQMITANDHFWDEYIKAHPDMQQYRGKIMPYYNKLCVICGHAIADGRYSLSCFDVDFSNEEKTPDNQIPTNNYRTKIDWSQAMDQYFLELMLDQVHRGNKLGSTFNKKSWADMIASFNTKLGTQYGKIVLKNRYNMFRRQCSGINTLLGLSGFCWDETGQMVIAEDRVWNNYIKANPNFRRFKNKPMPHYMDMRIICGNETDTETDITSFSLGVENGTPGKNIESAIDNSAEASSDLVGDENLSDEQKWSQPEMLHAFQKPAKVQRTDNNMADAMREVTMVIRSLTKKKEEENGISTRSVIDAVQAIPDIDEDLLLDACDFLEDEKKARMFLALDGSLRKKWLMRKLRPL